MQRAAKSFHDKEQQVKNLTRVIAGLACVAILLFGLVLGAAFLSVQLAKESHVNNNSAELTTTDGRTVKTSSADTCK